MRRPAPLPASAEEPEKAETEAPREPRSRLFGSRGPTAEAGRADADERPAADDHEEPVDAHAETAVIDDGSLPSGKDAATPLVRSSDVWRAARARRKALRAEIRRFTQRSRRRRIVVWGSVGAVLALVLGSVIAAYSPLFAVEKITVAGAHAVDAAAVQQALDGQIGAPLALVDASAVKSALMKFPIIESYALEARPPHDLLVRIVERTPVGVLRSDAGYTLVDAAGVVLATTPDKPEGQPTLSIKGGSDSAAFRSAGLVVRSLPAQLRAQVTKVTASSADDVTLSLGDGKTVVWGSEDDSVEKALVLVALIRNAPASRTFDVSAPSVPVVR
ncbi:cell division protein FtsQ [Microbacterium sp. W4I4]|uniref:FtsQ-type POTRA domain-containing protein n=1 Tax=Microbacterium sp. W4I4 TaxID=3042295 RepID=UPI002784D63B|nr:FtsQ-type POTRA domain-containing protein [Microbacterium sp. W4I4]MDQ0612459.1 cell division protein FtsQ [Microbacterium sp. W4I4]